MRKFWLVSGAVIALCVIAVASVLLGLAIPRPTGPFAVGRRSFGWIDRSRPELHTAATSDKRAVVGQIWFPAEQGSGEPAPYVERLSSISDGLANDGEIGAVAAWGLRFVRDKALVNAAIAQKRAPYPVVILSPGNATNVSFYAAIAEELASNGYVVIGVDHPYQSAAVVLPDGTVATYDARDDAASPAKAEEGIRRKIDERTADLRFVLSEVARRGVFRKRLDLRRVAVVGHSNGGIAAAEVCRTDDRFQACMNIDGQQMGGPFGIEPDARPPVQPFMFLTKEQRIQIRTAAEFERKGDGAYRVVIPAARHEDFTDGALFTPTVVPFIRTADDVMTVARGFTRAFLDLTLKRAPDRVLASVDAPTDVYVDVYPLGRQRPHGEVLPRAVGRSRL
ncbi:MAG TPA: alpha/beta fold hydrolase [Actinomycetota bacterium]|jgi:dienelactone hydrolase|nr:alpha/beta fold hydrolase [Actinomycetota bacterium]